MKKTITIIVIIFLLLLAGIGYVFFTNNSSVKVNSGNIFDNVKNFFPFGQPSQNTKSTSSSSQPTTNNQTTNNQPQIIERMFEISSAPIAGYTTFDIVSTSTKPSFDITKNSTTSSSANSSSTKQINTFVRFIERATGNLYETKIPTLDKNRITNTTIPKVYNAVLNSKGTETILQFLNGDTIQTVYAKVSTGTATTSTKIINNPEFPSNTDIVINKKDTIFYTTKSANGSTGFLSTFNNKKPIQVFSTPMRDILAQWSGGDIVAVFPKPHSDYSGVLFFINTKTNTTKQVASGINGLTAIPNQDGTKFLYNTNPKTLSLASRLISKNTDMNFNISTLPEKCVWSMENKNLVYCAVPLSVQEDGYPEKWYQGVVSFDDVLWSINTDTGEEKQIYNPTADGKASVDMTNLSLSDKEDYIFFTNKKDLTLWGISMN